MLNFFHNLQKRKHCESTKQLCLLRAYFFRLLELPPTSTQKNFAWELYKGGDFHREAKFEIFSKGFADFSKRANKDKKL